MGSAGGEITKVQCTAGERVEILSSKGSNKPHLTAGGPVPCSLYIVVRIFVFCLGRKSFGSFPFPIEYVRRSRSGLFP